MKKIAARSSIALLTFSIGILMTASILPFIQLPEVKVVADDFNSDSSGFLKAPQNRIEIQYYWTLINKTESSGVFVVTNNSNESIYYLGYEKNSHIGNWLKQNGSLESATKLPCLNGVKFQELRPNDTAMFEIPVPRNRKSFEAGFDFTNSIDSYDWQTTWIKVNEQAKFIAVPQYHLDR